MQGNNSKKLNFSCTVASSDVTLDFIKVIKNKSSSFLKTQEDAKDEINHKLPTVLSKSENEFVLREAVSPGNTSKSIQFR